MKQRLRLAAVSEKLLDVYAEDGMSLDQLMAFTMTTDHARQEQVWETLQRSYSQEPYQIRRMLTERTVRASDKHVLFVGLDAYEQAGVFVCIDSDGKLSVDRGYVRPEDEPPPAASTSTIIA